MNIVEKFQDDEAYYADKSYMSNSSFKLLRKSPTKFYLWRQGKWSYPNTSFFDVGSALHALFLEVRKYLCVGKELEEGMITRNSKQ